MHVGNDVVDLRDPDTRSGAPHPRFDIRVFHPTERVRIRGADAVARIRWTLWAAKESAFKVARKLDRTLPFHPRKFVVGLLTEGRAEVVHKTAGRFRVWLEEAQGWIHAVATPDPNPGAPAARPSSAVAVLEELRPSAAAASRRVRELVTDALAPLLSLDPAHLRIVTVDGIPQLWLAGRRLAVDVSLSHHGRVVACSWIRSSRDPLFA